MKDKNTTVPWGRYLKKTEYPVRKRALEKWTAENLVIEEIQDGLACRFSLQGSTCNSGGTPFFLVLHADIVPVKGRLEISDGKIEIPESERDIVGKMCVFTGGTDGPLRLEIPPELVGKPIEKGIASLKAVNPAGCVCTEANRNHKWLWFLATVHYALSSGSDRIE